MAEALNRYSIQENKYNGMEGSVLITIEFSIWFTIYMRVYDKIITEVQILETPEEK